MPDFVFFVYGRIKKLKWFRHIARSNVVKVIGQHELEEGLATDAEQQISSTESQNNLQIHDLSRLSKVENDIIKVVKKLDDIAAANITRFSKVEEDNKKSTTRSLVDYLRSFSIDSHSHQN